MLEIAKRTLNDITTYNNGKAGATNPMKAKPRFQ
jgi:hypothetical protein